MFSEHPCVFRRVPDEEGRPEARTEGGLRLLHAALRARDFGRVSGQEVVHRLVRGESRNWRQYSECISGQEDDILRMTTAPAFDEVANVVERIGSARVLRDGLVVKPDRLGGRIEHYVLEDGAEHLGRAIDLRLALGSEVDDLRVATTLEIEDPVLRPPMLIVANQPAIRISGKCRFSGSGKAEEQGCVAGSSDVCRAMH